MVSGADHNDYQLLAGEQMITAIDDFLSSVGEPPRQTTALP
jgi:hypothetical protein